MYPVNQVITCSAPGSSAVDPITVLWSHMIGSTEIINPAPASVGSSSLTLDSSWMGPMHTLNCTGISTFPTNIVPGQPDGNTASVSFTVGGYRLGVLFDLLIVLLFVWLNC